MSQPQGPVDERPKLRILLGNLAVRLSKLFLVLVAIGLVAVVALLIYLGIALTEWSRSSRAPQSRAVPISPSGATGAPTATATGIATESAPGTASDTPAPLPGPLSGPPKTPGSSPSPSPDGSSGRPADRYTAALLTGLAAGTVSLPANADFPEITGVGLERTPTLARVTFQETSYVDVAGTRTAVLHCFRDTIALTAQPPTATQAEIACTELAPPAPDGTVITPG